MAAADPAPNSLPSRDRKGAVLILFALAALSILAYAPSTRLPFIADDYLQIQLAREYGPVSGWPRVADDVLYRSRETSLILTYWTDRLFGLNPAAYYWSSLAVHIVNAWLLLALGISRAIGFRVSAVAAAFFAVYEGHQEAVIWYASLPELLVFTFSLASLLAWIKWLQSAAGSWRWWAASFALFCLALLSKEAAVVTVPLLVLFAWMEGAPRRAYLWLAPFVGVAVPYALAIFAASRSHLHLNDGTFSLRAPFLRTLATSTARLFWFWGLLGGACLALWRPRGAARTLMVAAAWIAITFAPYIFLTYMPRVPSRHTYFASAGLSLVAGLFLLAARDRFRGRRRWIPAALAVAMVLHNCGYLWIVKQRQFQERARPTEELIRFAARVDGPVYVHNFAYNFDIAASTLRVALGRQAVLVTGTEHPSGVPVFCWKK